MLERGDGESRERFLQKETLELRTQLALTLGEKQQLLDKSNQAEQLVKVTLQQLDEKDDTVRQLQDEVTFGLPTQFVDLSLLNLVLKYLI